MGWLCDSELQAAGATSTTDTRKAGHHRFAFEPAGCHLLVQGCGGAVLRLAQLRAACRRQLHCSCVAGLRIRPALQERVHLQGQRQPWAMGSILFVWPSRPGLVQARQHRRSAGNQQLRAALRPSGTPLPATQCCCLFQRKRDATGASGASHLPLCIVGTHMTGVSLQGSVQAVHRLGVPAAHVCCEGTWHTGSD